MSEQEQNDHVWFREQIAAALAGGLEPAARVRFEAHAAACASCAAELAASEDLERHMSGLFALPRAGLEDRVIASLRNERDRWRLRMRIHPAVQRAAVGVAAVLMLAGFGYLADQRLEDGRPVKVASNLREIGQKIPLYANDNSGTFPRTVAPVISSARQAGSQTPTTVADLQVQSQRLISQTRYQEALGVLDQMKALDPKNGYAAGLRPLVEDKYLFQQQHKYQEDFDRQFTKQLNPSEEKKIPYDDILRYPGNRPDAGVIRGENASKNSTSEGDSAGKYYYDGVVAANSSLDSGVANKIARAKVVAEHGASEHTRDSGALDANDSVLLSKDADGDGVAGYRFATGRDKRAVAVGEYFKPLQLESEKQTAGDETKSEHAIVRLRSTEVAAADVPGAAAVPALTPAQAMSGKSDDSSLVSALPSAPTVPATSPPPSTPSVGPAVEPVTSPTTRKVIRNGQMEFEVERFDAAFAQVSKLTTEAGGYVGTTNSEKLPNGKVKGTVSMRVPPDRLDTLVLQLRGIGDLKSQKLDANDVTKQYTDLESELRADRAMEERLLGMIKDGKGQIKDLLMAEKELGIWREKIEKIIGEMRYFDNQVAMSTLDVTLYERDIRTPATAKETENIDAGVEAVDVEKARADALEAIEDAKGRVIQSELKRYDAGQFGAMIVADVPPENAGPLVERLKQIGKVARLEIQRKQTSDPNTDPAAPSSAPVRVEKQNTRLNLSLYNLANVAPRTTSTINLAADDVGKAYHAIMDRVTKAGGRVVSSSLAQNKPEQTTGVINFEVPAAEADGVVNDLRAMGEVMRLTMTDNPDVNNVTAAKRGFALQLIATAAVAPRETETLQVAAATVSEAREKILSAASAGGARVLISQLNESDRNNPSAAIEVDVRRVVLAAVEKAIGEAGNVVSRSVARSSDAESVLDTKVKLLISLMPADKLPPRETTTLTIEASDVDAAMAKLQLAVSQAGGRVVESNLSKESGGGTHGVLSFEVPLDKAQPLLDEAKQQGTIRAAQSSKNLQAGAGTLAKARVELSLVTPDAIVEPGTGPWATIRNGWATSVKALLWSLELVVIGLCTVLPFGLVIWGGWKLLRRRTKSVEPTA